MRRRPPSADRSATRTAFRTCPLCEAGCGLEITLRPTHDGGEEVAAHPGRPRRRVQPGLHLPQGLHAQAAARGPRPPAPPAREARRRVRGGQLGRGLRRDRGPPPAHPRARRPQRLRGLPRQPDRPQPRRGCSTRGPCCGRSGRTNVFSASHGGPAAEGDLVRADVRRCAQRAGARRRPHRPPPHARRQPLRVQRQPGHRARLAGPPRAPRRARRHARGGRPSPVPHGRGGHGVGADPSGRRRLPAHGHGAGARSPRAWSTWARWRSSSPGSTIVDGRCAAVHPRGGGRGDGHRRPTTIRRLARELAAAPTACVYGRIGTTTAEFGTLTSWLVDVLNVLTGNLDRPGGAMFTKAAAGASQHPRQAPRRPGLRLHRRTQPGAGPARDDGRAARGGPRRGDRHARGGPGPGALTVAGNPVLSTPNSGRLDAALAGLEFMVSVDIYVNETTRHADVILPAPSAAAEGPLRRRAAAARAPQRGQLQRARAAARRGPARRVGGAGPPGARAPGRRRRGAIPPSSTT